MLLKVRYSSALNHRPGSTRIVKIRNSSRAYKTPIMFMFCPVRSHMEL
jgi:hypothetical protein